MEQLGTESRKTSWRPRHMARSEALKQINLPTSEGRRGVNLYDTNPNFTMGTQNHEKWRFYTPNIWVITPIYEGCGFPWHAQNYKRKSFKITNNVFWKIKFHHLINGIPLKQWSFQKLTDSRICPRLHHVCGTIARLQNQQNQGTKSANAYGNNFGSATVLTLDIVAFLRIFFVFRFPCGCSLVV